MNTIAQVFNTGMTVVPGVLTSVTVTSSVIDEAERMRGSGIGDFQSMYQKIYSKVHQRDYPHVLDLVSSSARYIAKSCDATHTHKTAKIGFYLVMGFGGILCVANRLGVDLDEVMLRQCGNLISIMPLSLQQHQDIWGKSHCPQYLRDDPRPIEPTLIKLMIQNTNLFGAISSYYISYASTELKTLGDILYNMFTLICQLACAHDISLTEEIIRNFPGCKCHRCLKSICDCPRQVWAII